MSFETDGKEASFFLRYGWTQASINQSSDYLGAGVTMKGILRARPNDVLGLAVASVRNGDDYRDALSVAGLSSDRRETNYELTYEP